MHSSTWNGINLDQIQMEYLPIDPVLNQVLRSAYDKRGKGLPNKGIKGAVSDGTTCIVLKSMER